MIQYKLSLVNSKLEGLSKTFIFKRVQGKLKNPWIYILDFISIRFQGITVLGYPIPDIKNKKETNNKKYVLHLLFIIWCEFSMFPIHSKCSYGTAINLLLFLKE